MNVGTFAEDILAEGTHLSHALLYHITCYIVTHFYYLDSTY